MFCSRCGKTVHIEDEKCRYCGAVIGPSRLSGSSRFVTTAAQDRTDAPEVARDGSRFTKTSYMTDAQQAERPEDQGDVAQRTIYRPVLRDDEAEGATNGDTFPVSDAEPESEPAEQRESEPYAPAQSAPAPDDPQSPKPRTVIHLTPVRKTGISREVQEHMQMLDENAKKVADRAAHKKSVKLPAFGRAKKSDDDDEMLEQIAPLTASLSESEDEEESESAEETRGPVFYAGALAWCKARVEQVKGLGSKKLMRIAGVALAVVVLIVAGSLWLGRVTADKAPIADVTYSLYSGALALLDGEATDAYLDDVRTLYNTDLTAVSTRYESEQASLAALLPAKPAANDETFLETAQTLQKSIQNAATMYTLANAEGAAESMKADFTAAWTKIGSALTMLKAATDPESLAQIGQASTVTVTSTPAPDTPSEDPAAAYIKLSKGMMNSNDVFNMQERLTELGYFSEECDGSFGSKTETAVKRFQKAVGQETDGIATPELQVLLYADDAPRRVVTATTAPTTEPTAEPTAAPAQN